ncbi:MAG: ABC transporter ATP-binding protein [Candidatus Abyssobacteria bacterium SURF_5]|uniref:ABC transporter ATP-binding protein n=1 Tax=Abyssobacteria bacterium (strain SURF_5) TaxID=2093360 RepID=A0A3A4NKB3_ABYX5|nr:MAG: ABC transporter ATP-binding protein [Candidatus Abyssubacteria bacterium SURF_5]
MHGPGIGTYHEEEALGKAYDARLVKRLWQYMRPYKGRIMLSLFFLLILSGFQLLQPYLVKRAIDEHILAGELRGLMLIVGIFFLAIIGEFFFGFLESLITSKTGQLVVFDLRIKIFRHLMTLSSRFFDRNPIGRLITRLTTDVEALEEMFAYGVVTILGDILKLVAIVVILFAVDFKLSLVTFAIVPFLLISTMFFRLKARDAFRAIRLTLARINSVLHENITGMGIVQMFSRERANRRQFEQVNDNLLGSQLRSVFYESGLSALVEFIGSVGLALILWYGGGQIVRNTLTFGSLVLFIQLVERFFEPIFSLSQQYTIMQSAMAASERIFKLLDSKDVIEDSPQPAPLDAVHGKIEFRNVGFGYKPDEPVIRDVSFKIKPGEKIAIVGATGAGKTTLIKLLTRMYDVTAGSILIDGKDIRGVDKHLLRRNIGMVLQDVFLFSGDIDYNIRLGNEALSPEMVKAAARKANVDAFINRFPGRYREPIKERGKNLSSGERQLISFARAFAYEPKILVLDEATSNVDTTTEILIQQAVRQLMQGRTSIVIAHRLSTIQGVDRIFVMHKGQLVEEGTHSELMKRQGIYYRLYLLQYKEQEASSPRPRPASPRKPPTVVKTSRMDGGSDSD